MYMYMYNIKESNQTVYLPFVFECPDINTYIIYTGCMVSTVTC